MMTRTTVKMGIPEYFKERCVVRCTESKFGPNKKGNPMITISWEMCGLPNNTGSCDLEFKRGEHVYQIGGLTINPPSWFTLVPAAINFYADFWERANPGLVFSVNEEDPDIAYLDGLCMEAIVTGKNNIERKILSPEEMEELKEAGKPLVGEPILDGEGNQITRPQLSVTMWLRKFTGEPPLPF